MAVTEEELEARLAALDEAIATGVARADYTGFGSLTYKSMAELRQARAAAADELLRLRQRKRPRFIRVLVKDAL